MESGLVGVARFARKFGPKFPASRVECRLLASPLAWPCLRCCFRWTPAKAAVEIQWWHAMQNELNPPARQARLRLQRVRSASFASFQSNKGLYNETLSAAIVALRSRQQPAIVQVAEVATATMMAAKGAVYPVYELMRDQGETFNPKAYLPAITLRRTPTCPRQHAVVSVQRLDFLSSITTETCSAPPASTP